MSVEAGLIKIIYREMFCKNIHLAYICFHQSNC